jgi:hypothetical protein
LYEEAADIAGDLNSMVLQIVEEDSGNNVEKEQGTDNNPGDGAETCLVSVTDGIAVVGGWWLVQEGGSGG